MSYKDRERSGCKKKVCCTIFEKDRNRASSISACNHQGLPLMQKVEKQFFFSHPAFYPEFKVGIVHFKPFFNLILICNAGTIIIFYFQNSHLLILEFGEQVGKLPYRKHRRLTSIISKHNFIYAFKRTRRNNYG